MAYFIVAYQNVLILGRLPGLWKHAGADPSSVGLFVIGGYFFARGQAGVHRLCLRVASFKWLASGRWYKIFPSRADHFVVALGLSRLMPWRRIEAHEFWACAY